MINPLKNQRGAALAVVIIAMAVLMVLGSAVLGLGQSETTLSIKNEKDIQAEYIARAGADIAAKYISDDPDTSISILTDTLGEGSFSASIIRVDSSTVKIISTGTVGDSQKSVTLILERMTYRDLFTGMRQTGIDNLDLSAMNVEYEPGTTVAIEANVSSLDQITLSSEDSADPNIIKSLNNDIPQSVDIPDTTGFQTELPELVSGVRTLTGDYCIPLLAKANGETIIFDTQGSDMHIVVNTLAFTGSQGTVLIQGGGNVHVYIIDSGDIQNPVSINSSDPGNLFIYVMDGKSITISANGVINAYIYAPGATVEIQSDLTTVRGSIIGQIINRGNINGAKGTFYYDPLDNDPLDDPIKLNFKKVRYIK